MRAPSPVACGCGVDVAADPMPLLEKPCSLFGKRHAQRLQQRRWARRAATVAQRHGQRELAPTRADRVRAVSAILPSSADVELPIHLDSCRPGRSSRRCRPQIRRIAARTALEAPSRQPGVAFVRHQHLVARDFGQRSRCCPRRRLPDAAPAARTAASRSSNSSSPSSRVCTSRQA